MGYILFSSDDEITISTTLPHWDGIIEYSYDNKTWRTWNAEWIINNKIYMRGINNTVISYASSWHINGTNIKCQGNIENLLDYKSVINNVHPKMGEWAFAHLFSDCTSLIEAPQLSAIELADFCYCRMFANCISLEKCPLLLAKKMADYCCYYMFCNCIKLTTVELPSLRFAKETIINQRMFDFCPLTTITVNNKLYDFNVLKLL